MDAYGSLKKAFFPNITDWSSDYLEYRNAKKWWKLSTPIFIVFHPIGTKWFLTGGNLILTIFTTGIGFFLMFYLKWTIPALILWLISLIFVKKTVDKFREWSSSNYTIYDIYFREP